MAVFGKYASYYDLLYRDKDYQAEADYIHDLLRRFHPKTVDILDVGCGTGRHARLLAEHGMRVHGVDMSEEMLDQAEQMRTDGLPSSWAKALSFSLGDVRKFRLKRKFDAVVSLFHVMSYQTTNQDLLSAFETARYHLKPGGVFIFDCWYGPAVLTQRPTVRVKKYENREMEVTRIAEPEMLPNQNIVEVNYRILVHDKLNHNVESFEEQHRMRYLFKPEVEFLLESNRLRFEACEEYLTLKEPSIRSWSICFIAKCQ